MTGSEWKKMERVIPVAPWTDLNMGGDKRERMQRKNGEKRNWKMETNEQGTKLEQKEQAR